MWTNLKSLLNSSSDMNIGMIRHHKVYTQALRNSQAQLCDRVILFVLDRLIHVRFKYIFTRYISLKTEIVNL